MFYQQPPTNLTPGQATGRFTINKQVVDLKHAYARLIKWDLFDETQNDFNVWLTEKPVAAEALTDDDDVLQKSTDGVVLVYTSTGILDRWLPNILSGGEFNPLPGVERDYVRHSNAAIEGRLFSAFPIFVEGREHEINVLFNASMLPPLVSDGPVSAREGGEQLPADGGDPMKAYLAAMERMKGIKNFDEGISTWSSLVTKDAAERIKKDLQSVTAEQRQLLVDVFAPLENPKLTGALTTDNKATLRFSGTAKGEKAEEVVNMHLEDGQWKIGRREIRVD